MSPLGLGLGRSLIKENWDYRRRQKHLLEFSSSSVTPSVLITIDLPPGREPERKSHIFYPTAITSILLRSTSQSIEVINPAYN